MESAKNMHEKTQQAGSDNSAATKIAVIGIGNILFGDEGLGVYGVAYLQANYDFFPALDLIDGGTLGMNLVDVLLSYRKVLILDTISVDDADAAGTVYDLPAEVLQGLGSYRRTAHEIEVLQALELASLAGEAQSLAEVRIIGMVPQTIEQVQMNLTTAVEQAWPDLMASAVQVLHGWQVRVSPASQNKSLRQIIAAYQQASAVREARHG
jgi:hydrogenase maturation protease